MTKRTLGYGAFRVFQLTREFALCDLPVTRTYVMIIWRRPTSWTRCLGDCARTMAIVMMAFVLLAARALLSADVYASSTPNAVCATAKLKAAAQKMAAKLKCQTSAIKGARAVDVACLLKAEQKFAAAFVKAEAKGGCVMSGDADVVESHVDGGVSTLVADEPGGPESQWVPLIGRSWTMPAGSEGYRCRRIQVQSDMYITGFRAVSTSTVFTMTVSVSSTSTPLGDYDCSPNNIDQRVIYESGIGTNDLEFPLGVGVHLHAGDYVNVNLSLDNEGTKAADGFAGVLVRTGSAASVINNAGLVLAGTFSISIPNDGMPHTRPMVDAPGLGRVRWSRCGRISMPGARM